FHVSNPSRIYKNWLYAVLRALYTHREKIRFNSYIRFLEKLCDNFYFGNNCQEKDITDIILGEEKINFYSNNKKWNDGVLVPNFVFNRLDYQLWKKYKEKYPKFRFTFRSSVEHHYPQHPSEEYGLERLEKKILDNFGNLYLLSQSKNSRLSNLTPEAKCSYYKNKNYDSLKQALMMEKTKELNNWKNEEILKHGEEMLEILNQPLSKADS
ncbi:TPA: HNH endonuclease family protein, partial [Haemophilus influenzae 10810]